MADADDVRRLALALPHVVEIESDGFDFRVADKGFVWSYPERRPGKPRVIRTDIAVLYVGDEAEKQALLLGEPEAFFTTRGYDGWPLVMLRLAQVDVEASAGTRDRRLADAGTGRTGRRPRPGRSPVRRRSRLSRSLTRYRRGRVSAAGQGIQTADRERSPALSRPSGDLPSRAPKRRSAISRDGVA